MSDHVSDPEAELPGIAGEFAGDYEHVWDAYADLGASASGAGPLDEQTKRLVKLALSIGADSEGAVHSHVRRAQEDGIDDAALEHVAILAITTLGFPQAMAALSWIRDITEPDN